MLLEHLPPLLAELWELRALMEALEPEALSAWEGARCAADELFLSTLTPWGIERWEGILAITPHPGQSDQARRFAIATKLMEQTPYTVRALERMLEALCGPDGWSLELWPDRYALRVKIAVHAGSSFGDVQALLERVIPANLTLVVSLKYNEHRMLTPMTHGQLADLSHMQIREEELNLANLHTQP